ASHVGATIQQDKLPLSNAYRALAGKIGMRYAMSGGEDYELLFCAAPRQRKRIEKLNQLAGVAISRIGVCMPFGNGVHVVDASGATIAVKSAGHDHFKKP
ncbi:MAG: thiamine-phosphate kinase, partial [Candidatus Binatia bacterium]